MGILFLIGPRGSGKTMAARLLAESAACRTCDTDRLIVDREGRSVADIVADLGWPGFRALEKTVLRRAVEDMADGEGHAVVATGGGVVLDEDNRRLMRERGTVVYLHAPWDVLARRLNLRGDDASRPALSGLAPLDEIRKVAVERDPLYREAAHHVIDAARRPEDIADDLRQLLTTGKIP